jgi:peptidyl-dipeptidase Dcp
MHNPFLTENKQAFGSFPFQDIENEHYLPAFAQAFAQHKAEIEAIVANTTPANFENCVEAYEASGALLDEVSSVFFNINSAETNPEMEAIAQEISPKLSEHGQDIIQNEALFAKIKQVYEAKNSLNLNPEQQELLDKTYLSFVRSGALLSPEIKAKLKQIDMDLSLKELQFQQNILAATNAFQHQESDAAALAGIPQNQLEQFAHSAQEAGQTGYLIGLDFPSIQAVLTYANHRGLRQKIAVANAKKAEQGDWDNRPLMIDIAQLRQQKAELLGYPNFAAYILAERMAKDVNAVTDFLKDLQQKAKSHLQKDLSQIEDIAKSEGFFDRNDKKIESFDHAYFAEKGRQQHYDLNEEALRPYFELNSVLQASFALAERLFGIQFQPRPDVQVYHPDVQAYEVLENGQHKALFYADFHPRKGKRPGAWMTSFRSQSIQNGHAKRPHVAIVCNFSKPTASTPSLLNFTEVTTLLHELGHALHGIMANTQYASLSGTSVSWDFVELPSQFMENYAYEPEFLTGFAKHYQSQEPLPIAEIEKIIAAKSFMQGYQTCRQIIFGTLDMAYHTQTQPIENAIDFENQVLKDLRIYPNLQEACQGSSFSHIFSGGYAAGYYSYKWAEVLDADAFAYFKSQGIYNANLAAKFKYLLSQGGTQEPMALYQQFRGQAPSLDALIERSFGKA